MKDGILILAHGSRARDLKDELVPIVEWVKEESGLDIVEVCFLEFTEPDFTEGMKRCIAQGATRITVTPYLLNVGTHLRRDLPELLANARRDHPEIALQKAPHLGVDRLLAQLVVKRYQQAESVEEAS